jgi:hypothetical protein
MKTKISVLITFLLLGSAATIYADTSGNRSYAFGLGVGATTLGAQGSGIISLGPHFTVGLAYNDDVGIELKKDFTVDNVDYTGQAKLNSLLGTLNFFPAVESLFHISAGVALNGNEVTDTVNPVNGFVDINGVPVPIAAFGGSITGTSKFEPVAPYLGIGFGGNPSKRFADGHLFVDFNLGVLYQGKTTTTLNSANGLLNPQVNELASEIDNEASPYQLYPVVGLTLYYFM